MKKSGSHFYLWVVGAIVLGGLIGHFFPEFGVKLKPLGDGFIALIKMLIGPIIFLSNQLHLIFHLLPHSQQHMYPYLNDLDSFQYKFLNTIHSSLERIQYHPNKHHVHLRWVESNL